MWGTYCGLEPLGHILTADETVVGDGLVDVFILMGELMMYIRKKFRACTCDLIAVVAQGF